MFATTFKPFILLFPIIGMVTGASADSVSLPTYLQRLGDTEVNFNGHIQYQEDSRSDDKYVFYDDDGVGFPVTLDADKKTREQIEAECADSAFILSLFDRCRIEGLGTIDIRGNRIHLNIEVIKDLSKPTR